MISDEKIQFYCGNIVCACGHQKSILSMHQANHTRVCEFCGQLNYVRIDTKYSLSTWDEMWKVLRKLEVARLN